MLWTTCSIKAMNITIYFDRTSVTTSWTSTIMLHCTLGSTLYSQNILEAIQDYYKSTHLFDPILIDPSSTGPKHTARFWQVILFCALLAETFFKWLRRAYRVALSAGGRWILLSSSNNDRMWFDWDILASVSDWYWGNSTTGVGSKAEETGVTTFDPEITRV